MTRSDDCCYCRLISDRRTVQREARRATAATEANVGRLLQVAKGEHDGYKCVAYVSW